MKLLHRLSAVAITLLVILAVIGGREKHEREDEISSNLRFPDDEPLLKYEFIPGELENSYGYNERELPLEKVPGTRRVAILGDSVTHGAGVPAGQLYSRVAEDLAHAAGQSDIQILNFGVYGYDIESIRGLVRSRIGRFSPDLVVYGFYVNDPIPTELVNVDHDGRKPFPVWVGTGPRDFTVFGRKLDLWLHSRSALFRSLEGAAAARMVAARGDAQPLQWGWFEQQLDGLVADARKLGVPMVALLIPPHVLVEPEPRACDRIAEAPGFCEKNMEVLVRAQQLFYERRIRVIDGLRAYRQGEKVDLHFIPSDPHHPNAEGHRRLGVALAAVLPELLP